MKIAAVACFSNELAIASAFRDQLETFFDKSYLVSHNSYDKTEAIFAGSELFEVTVVKDIIFRQAELVRSEMVKAFAEGADWVVLLDFDEFLPFDDRSQFEKFLSLHSTKDVISWNWQNIFPEQLGHANLFSQPFLTIEGASSYTKVIISKSAYEKDPDLVVGHGSHSVNANRKMVLHNETDLKLIHIPFHGFEHLKQKMMQRAVLEGATGFFRDFLDVYVSTGTFDNEQIKDVALNYCSEVSSKNSPTIFGFKFPYIKSEYLYEKDSTIDSLFATVHTYILNRDNSEKTLIERELYLEQAAARAIIQSRSWKITRPLRAANSALKKFKSLKI